MRHEHASHPAVEFGGLPHPVAPIAPPCVRARSSSVDRRGDEVSVSPPPGIHCRLCQDCRLSNAFADDWCLCPQRLPEGDSLLRGATYLMRRLLINLRIPLLAAPALRAADKCLRCGMSIHYAELAAEGCAGRRRFACRVRRSGVWSKFLGICAQQPLHPGFGSNVYEQLVPHRWFIPSNIGVPAFGGASLFGKFTQVSVTGCDTLTNYCCPGSVCEALNPSEAIVCATQSIGANLARFPTGPALNDPFWCVAGSAVRFRWDRQRKAPRTTWHDSCQTAS